MKPLADILPKISLSFAAQPKDLSSYDACITVVDAEQKKSHTAVSIPKHLLERQAFEFKEGKVVGFDTATFKQVVACSGPKQDMFAILSTSRKAVGATWDVVPARILLDLSHLTAASASMWGEALTAALTAKAYQFPKYEGDAKKKGAKKDDEKPYRVKEWHLTVSAKDKQNELKDACERGLVLTQGNNIVRYLGKTVSNDLNPANYRKWIEAFAKELGLKSHFTSFSELKKMGAGAFVAVSQGSAICETSGIVELEYTPKAKKNSKSHVALIGKGITYDTGGTNLKPAEYMFGMQADMTGSAVALALCYAAQHLQFARPVRAYLAICENAIGPLAYRPNEVVVTLSGKTIETVHTDAEGRMILADTLTLASREKPERMIDFATLTGACVRAIGDNYSGIFCNRPQLTSRLIEAGKTSGERLWPFPLDDDFGKCLDSQVADIKQCRLRGGVDHIEAAWFLKQFLADDPVWMHVDLSAAEHDGGLAHIASEETGFGVRCGWQLMEMDL